jgi:hypothetical protein
MRAVLHGVVEQVDEYLLQAQRVNDCFERGWSLQGERVLRVDRGLGRQQRQRLTRLTPSNAAASETL